MLRLLKKDFDIQLNHQQLMKTCAECIETPLESFEKDHTVETSTKSDDIIDSSFCKNPEICTNLQYLSMIF